MGLQDSEFAAKLLATFKVEAKEHLQSLNEGLLKLEHPSTDLNIKEEIDTIFRGAHSLKGGARAVALAPVEKICQALENVLSEWREKPEALKSASFDVLYETLDLIDQSLSSYETNRLEELQPAIEKMMQKLAAMKPSSEKLALSSPYAKTSEIPHPSESVPSSREEASSPTIRIAAFKLDRLLQQIEETLLIKLSEEQFLKKLKEFGACLENWENAWYHLQPEIRHLRTFLAHPEQKGIFPSHETNKILDFFDYQSENFKTLNRTYHTLQSASMQDFRMTSGMIDGLLDETKKVVMQPLSTLLKPFPRMIRDIAHTLNKDIHFEIQGGEIEIDRRILEELKDPLIHLVRNCIDHGIETTEIRLKRKKSPQGKIVIAATQIAGNQVEIAISDDGEGIQMEKIKKAALKNKLFTEAQLVGMGEVETLKLIFHSGFSTSPIITELSGRGMGMSIVSQNIEKLGGKILIQTQPEKGTTFLLQFPLSLATFRGIHLKLFDQDYMISTQNVKKVVKLQPEDLHHVEDQWMFDLKGEAIPYLPLSHLLKISPPENTVEGHFPYGIVIYSNRGTVAIGVSQILGEQEVFVKSTGKQVKRLQNISSATILEQGTVVLILDPLDLIRTALNTQARLVSAAEQEEKTAEKKRHRILIAEDSVTARTLLKNILETANYEVKTAVDGAEALMLLKSEPFDLLVSDIEMPRMNGFDLTKKIRDTKGMENFPVILCTSLGSKEDREHGIDVGASAYIDKSSFAQSNLLDIIQKLL